MFVRTRPARCVGSARELGTSREGPHEGIPARYLRCPLGSGRSNGPGDHVLGSPDDLFVGLAGVDALCSARGDPCLVKSAYLLVRDGHADLDARH
jgi:hypothetical protein